MRDVQTVSMVMLLLQEIAQSVAATPAGRMHVIINKDTARARLT